MTRDYLVNGLNQYTSAGPSAFTYDANGNLTSDGAVNFTYDVENRLIAASGAKTANLIYDPLGRLYETNQGGAAKTRFIYDGDALVLEYDQLGTIKHRYVHGSGVDQPLVWYDGGTVNATNRRHLFANWQGSISAITDSAGNVVQINAYDAYGIPNATNLGRFQYTGQILIPEIGIYHYKARAYSPYLGRFLQTDPIGYEDQYNLYAYVANDPVGRIDPNGESWKDVGNIIVGGLKAVYGGVGIATGVAVTGGSLVTTVGTGGVATPVSVPTAVAGVALTAASTVVAVDGAKQLSEGLKGLVSEARSKKPPKRAGDSNRKGHNKGARGSTKPKHEGGNASGRKDRDGEKGDHRRRLPRKPPGGKTQKGGWPPKLKDSR